MPTMDLTRLQFLVLESLKDGERSGGELRRMLEDAGHARSGPAFYQIMSRLEKAGFLKGRYEPLLIDGQTFRERRYTITAEGDAALEAVIAFYREQLARRGLGFTFG